jgi:hypothetical protein
MLLMNDSTMLNNNAHQKLSTLNPSPKIQSAVKIITALTTNKNKPSVRMVAGMVRKINNGLSETLSTASKAATNTA